MANLDKFKNWLREPVNGYMIGLFRVIYGLFMCYEVTNYMQIQLVRNMFVLPKVNFKFDYLEWLQPLPEDGLNAVIFVMLGCAVLITLGLFMKWACRIFAVLYAYIFLLDKSIYNNHIYLFILLAVLLSLTDADQFLSLRKRRLPDIAVPRWQQFILQVQVMCVYFFASIIKMRADWWLLKQPVKAISFTMPADSFLAPLYKSDIGINMMVYLGFSIDFFAPLLLWYKPLRNWAVIPFALFHFSNSRIFGDIGIFPYIMMCGLLLYFEMEEIPLLGKRFPAVSKQTARLADPVIRESTRIFLLAYFTFQLLFPWRGLFLPNDLDYTTIGNRFSWRVKADVRVITEFKIILKDPRSGEEAEVNFRSMINDMQIKAMIYDPRAIRSFAQMMKREAAKNGIPNAQVFAKIQIRVNDRPPQYFVDPNVDMASVSYSPFRKLDWVIPLEY